MADESNQVDRGEPVERGFRHGFEARDRFADRPFDEVEEYLRSSWESMQAGAEWDEVRSAVRSGYENYKGADLPSSAELPPEAELRFPEQNVNGSHVAGGNVPLGTRFATPTQEEPAGGTSDTPAGAPQLPEGDAGSED